MSLAILEYAFLLRARMALGALPVKWTFKRVRPAGKEKSLKDMTAEDSERQYKEWSNKIDRRSLVVSLCGYCLTVLLYGLYTCPEIQS